MIGDTRFEVKASLNENGEATVKVFGRCSYGEGDGKRDATVFVDVTDETVVAKVGKAMTAAITEVREELNKMAVKDAMKCGSVAMERGEL